MKSHPLLKIINNSLIDLPTPVNITLWWNIGSLAGITLLIQILRGLLLVIYGYCPNINFSFERVIIIQQDINWGWLVRPLHANGASIFFLFLYLHIGRGIYFQSYTYIETWTIGVTLFLISIGTAFLGYVLPWGQISYWGATVITGLLSVIPYYGDNLVEWIWGNFIVSTPTLARFFGLHFLLPFLILGISMVHLLFLHQTGSTNPLGINSNKYKLRFHPYFTIKDTLGFIILFLILLILLVYFPYILNDPDNFNPANPIITPIHIQPEWYFLFAYAILRSIPNKGGGVIALLLSIIILYTLPLNNINKFQGSQFYPLTQILFWIFINTILLLTWIGTRPVDNPYIFIGQILTLIYFTFYLLLPSININWDKILK